MARSNGSGNRSRKSRARGADDGGVERTNRRMPPFPPRTIDDDNVNQQDLGYSWDVEGPTESAGATEGLVDVSRIARQDGLYTYDHTEGYPLHYPLDRHLYSFLQGFSPVGMEDDDPILPEERRRLERAILAGRDGMQGLCFLTYPSYPEGFAR